MDTVKGQHGYLNLLVNNAGVALNRLPTLPTPQTGDIKTLQEILLTGPREDYAKTFDINVTAAFYCSIQFLELLDAGNKRGNMPGVTSQIITLSSSGGFRRDDKVFTVSYTLSKGAAIHLGKLLANFLKDWDIRSNVIAPGVFPSGEQCSQGHVPGFVSLAHGLALLHSRDVRRFDTGRHDQGSRAPWSRGIYRRHGRSDTLSR